jgi:hypothetical protein
MWERGKLPEGGGTLPGEPGREPSGRGGLACPFSATPLHTALYFTRPAVPFSSYYVSRRLRHLRRLGHVNSFLAREHTLTSSYGD